MDWLGSILDIVVAFGAGNAFTAYAWPWLKDPAKNLVKWIWDKAKSRFVKS